MKIAAVLYDGEKSAAADKLIREVAGALRKDGIGLCGAVQSNVAALNRSRCEIALEDLATGRVIKASQDRGPLARGCRLDSGALEESVGLAESSLAEETRLVIVNRFGKQEAEGRGFRALIEKAVLAEIPVLVGLNRAHVVAWHEFVGENPTLLPMDEREVMAWCSLNTAVEPETEIGNCQRAAEST